MEHSTGVWGAILKPNKDMHLGGGASELDLIVIMSNNGDRQS